MCLGTVNTTKSEIKWKLLLQIKPQKIGTLLCLGTVNTTKSEIKWKLLLQIKPQTIRDTFVPGNC